MAFPQIRSDGYRYGAETVNTTAHSISLPINEIQADDLILVFFAIDSSEGLTIDTIISGINWVTETTYSTTNVTAGIFWKIAEGEGYDYLTINTASEMASFVSYTITGYRESEPITVSTSATGSSTNMDPPSLTPLYGGQDYLWFVFGAMDGFVSASAAPSNFSDLLTANNLEEDGCTCSVANRQYNTTSAYNPGTFTNSTGDWIAFTVIVNPAPPLGIGISNLFIKN